MSTPNNWLIKVFQVNLKFFMGLKDFTQADLASRLKVSKTQINKLFGEGANPTVETILSLSIALDIPPHFLFRVDLENWWETLDKKVQDSTDGDSIDHIEETLISYHSAKSIWKELKPKKEIANPKKSK